MNQLLIINKKTSLRSANFEGLWLAVGHDGPWHRDRKIKGKKEKQKQR